uniref:FCH and mu domain containing endocytic adaptor 2 n=1 Tax=Monodelphis domestica TaxID=13616 RepID=A0A5F8H3I3_MONDO
MVMAHFVESFWGERNSGFDVLYHNMKHGQISTKELADFVRERATIEEAYSRSMTKLAKSASNYTQLGTFAPVWDVFKSSTEKLASCHLELVRKLQELIKEVQKYGEEQVKSHKKAAIKSKKATDTYKLYVEKYATAKSDFEQKMTETAQKFQDIEETHLIHIKEIIKSLSNAIQEIHLQIGLIHEEFMNNMANTTVEGLIQKFAESKGTGKERPGLIEFEECDAASVVEGIKPRKRKTFALPGIIKKEKDAESVECPDADSVNIPDVDEEGYSIKPEANQNDTKENHFYSSSDSDSEDEEPKKYRIEIKPVHPNNSHHTMASLDELKVSIGNISLSPAVSRHSPVQMNRNSSSEELTKSKLSAPPNEKGNSDLLAWDPLFGPSLDASNSTSVTSAILKEQNRNSSSFSIGLPECIIAESLLGYESDSGARSISPDFSINSLCNPDVTTSSESTDVFSFASWSQSQWISFTDELVTVKHPNADQKAFQRLRCKTENLFKFPDTLPGRSSNIGSSEDQSNLCSNVICPEILLTEETESAAEKSSTSSSVPLDSSLVSTFAQINDARPTTPLSTGTIVPPPRPTSRPKLTSSKLSGINEIPRPFSPPVTSNTSPPPAAPLARAESTSSISSSASLSAANTPTIGVSRGPSPVSLGNQDTLPVAVALTESVNAYFKGADPTKCIVKITGDMTVSFPSGIIKVFTSNPSPAVLCFRVKNTSKLEQILPNAQLVFSDPSQCDSSAKDFWMNMQAVTLYLKKLAEQNPSASYYNVDVLKYQVSSNGIQSTPLNLATYWKCNASTTDVRVDYKYNPEAMIAPSVLSNIQVVVPVDGGVTNMQSLPPAAWNAEQMKAYWKLSCISEKSENGGSGSLRAKFDLSEGPSKPMTLAVQFISEGSTLSGADIELVGTGYRLSLLKKRFATGRYLADC